MNTFNFANLAILFAAISLGLIGVAMAGSMFWPEQAERYKKMITTVITGVVLVSLTSAIIAALQ